ncbi:unnamed protein product [Darwinula stevensoni]|uniref:Uncharacterized protein n=1 Tax=Darwinula stevensoni TaxID=69355 RepID=A0A7R8X0V5_9CRUS|nr:unnamed protein product [Darwinula stevensoni]CAG0879568.1 unnamed protein product [Darwinula stevensoni]
MSVAAVRRCVGRRLWRLCTFAASGRETAPPFLPTAVIPSSTRPLRRFTTWKGRHLPSSSWQLSLSSADRLGFGVSWPKVKAFGQELMSSHLRTSHTWKFHV